MTRFGLDGSSELSSALIRVYTVDVIPQWIGNSSPGALMSHNIVEFVYEY